MAYETSYDNCKTWVIVQYLIFGFMTFWHPAHERSITGYMSLYYPLGTFFFFFLPLVASKRFLRDIWVKPLYCAEPVGITVMEWWNFKGKEAFAFSGHGSRNPISARSVNERNISELVFPFWYHDVYNMECKVQPDLHLNPSSALMSKVFSVSKPQFSQENGDNITYFICLF